MKTIASEDVARWVLQAQQGSSAAFNRLHRGFVALVHGILLSRFRPTIAEELTQECFLIALQKLNQLHEPSKFGPWIATIARRMDADNERYASVELDDAQIIDEAASPESITDANIVLAAIHTLPDAYRETLVLRLVEGMSGPEIADATGLNPDSVRVNLHRGMAKLREALGIQLRAVNEHD